MQGSHKKNDDYMELFHDNYAKQQNQRRGGPSRAPQIQSDPYSARVSARTSARSKGATGSTALSGVYSQRIIQQSMAVRPSKQWETGPLNPSGVLCPKVNEERNQTLCMSVFGDEVVVGSTDHALYTYDTESGRHKRTLFPRSGEGHNEWVTCVDHLSDGTIVSGGMEGKICVWSKLHIRCKALTGHVGSISQVLAGQTGSIVLSAGRDKKLMFWDAHRGSHLATMAGHKAPIMKMGWNHNRIISGDRDGLLKIWDATVCRQCTKVEVKHGGHITALATSVSDVTLAITGDQHGTVRTFDLRSGNCSHTLPLHKGADGLVPSVNEIALIGDLMVTAGSDGLIKVIDPRMIAKPMHSIDSHSDHIYSMATYGSLVFTGSGDGLLLAHDVIRGELLYGLGANEAAVRCIHIDGESNKLVTSGDDGNVLVYNF
eukprot:TRINITY_DN11929_c0_g1_i1.p1 TRINITY_DN11929_c0_g1~~TRINITY_DN11929_c0_g1_i1.p1  ORF type:complete len:430 (+),score=93.25 TRINITY_DN11929_c0_g1_i1:151-1440(+)